jgi:alkanesulfonate monooxygenase SsuD/methylene tetrahydromethanopterin reductase-like flavin-dependent oxidoreductase (luciferase family)
MRARLRRLAPAPLRGRIPLLVAGGGERVMLALVAEHADLWNCYGTPAELAHKSAILDEHCARIGRDPGEIERTVLLDDDETAFADGYLKAGMTHLIVTLSAPRYDVAQLERLCAWRDRQAA